MAHNRRSVLQLGGMAALSPLVAAAPAQAVAAATGPQGAIRNLTVTTLMNSGAPSLGVRTARGVLDVGAAETALRQGLPTTVDGLIRGQGDRAALQRLIANPPSGARFIPEAEVRFGPVVTAPEKIVCMGLNYRAHIAEVGRATPAAPSLFNKFNSCLNSHRGTINVSAERKAVKFDYEAELVIIMGRRARDVAEADALNYVFGYCSGNDFSARDLQNASTQWMAGKAGDGSGPIGPWLVSADQVDPDNLDIKCLINGEIRQSSNTSMMIYSCRQMIAYMSSCFTLNAGDVIFTGTPEGVINGMAPERQVWLKKGDKVVTAIQHLGDLEFTLV